jgi:hypothetical protein
MNLLKHGKVPPPVPPHVAKNVGEARALYDIVKTQGREGYEGIVQVEKALGRLEFEAEERERDPDAEDSFPQPQPLPGESADETPTETEEVPRA